MQLHDFSRRWQLQPLAGTKAVDTVQLQELLKNRSGLVEKMRRNARVEMALTALLVMVFCLLLFKSDKLLSVVQASFLLFVGLGQLYYYYYKLGVLRRMATVEGNVQAHLQKMCVELRRLLRFFYQASLVMGPFTLFLGFCYSLGTEIVRPEGIRVNHLLILAGVLILFGIVLQIGVVYGTRWYVRRLYGQHLDRLEGYLHELQAD